MTMIPRAIAFGVLLACQGFVGRDTNGFHLGGHTTRTELVPYRFVACWDKLDDLRTGNAGLPDVHELLFIAL